MLPLDDSAPNSEPPELIIDVRSAAEYKEAHARGATNWDFQNSQPLPQQLLNSVGKSGSIWLYCRSGGRADAARQLLEAEGYTNVTNAGGLEQINSMLDEISGGNCVSAQGKYT